MSSGNLVYPTHPHAFQWSNTLDKDDYVFATYRVSASCEGEKAALGMAMEQSAATLQIQGYVEPSMLEDWTIRVVTCQPINDGNSKEVVSPYFLRTEVYREGNRNLAHNYQVELAIPLCLLGEKPAQLLNVLVGELPRLGFLTSFRLTDIQFPKPFGPGPAFGAEGILALLGKQEGPILCRSMRPAVGLDTEMMAKLNHDVLVGGFHMVKDDELAYFADLNHFRNHVQRMVAARDEAMQVSGERKLYLANLICEPDELQDRWEVANELGADAVLVAPFIQGLGVVSTLARQARIPILAHNTFSDLMMRNTTWGIDDSVVYTWLRQLGADWFVTPGPFAAESMDHQVPPNLLEAAVAPAELKAMMPIIQGGKHPDGLDIYRQAVANDNFMLIVASWVDGHEDGLMDAARIFRNVVDNIQLCETSATGT